MKSQFDYRERVSDLMDGRLDDEAWATLMARLDEDDDVRECWQAYHVARDVLRSDAAPVGAGSADFVLRLQSRLAQEAPTLPATLPLAPVVARVAGPVGEAANASVFRWRVAAGVASLAAVAALAWHGWSGGLAPAGPQLASTDGNVAVPVAVAESGGAAVMIRDPRLDELLAAHKQAGAGSALQMPAGFLRNATFEGPGR